MSTAPASASIDLIRRLVAFDTTSRNSNLELIHWVRDYLDGHGIASDLMFDATGTKANLFATVGPADRPGVMLSGHTDVVPVDGQDWHSNPFAVMPKDGRLYGRGTSDMKSFIAIALAMVPEFKAAGLRQPIHLALSYDEEVGCLGGRQLAEVLAKAPVKPQACVVGEPTEMQVVVAHKGKKSWRVHVHGHECHSSLTHTGVNAVEVAAELVAALRAMAREKRERGPFEPDFTPPYSTIHTGTIRGGTALNIVPKDCSFEFEVRNLPFDDADVVMARLQALAADKLLPEMHAVNPATGIDYEFRSEFPALSTPADAGVTQMARALSGANATSKVAFGTEAGLYSEAGVPTIVCGPGSIDQAHKPDEFIALDQIAQCETFLRRLIERCKNP